MAHVIKGSCIEMCPSPERHTRQSERLLHRLEMVRGTERDKYPRADPNKTVKCFSRSAADMNMAVPHLLRPFDTLQKTVVYLISTALQSGEVSELSAYYFVWDRLRAVRQDMVIQALPADQTVQLLEPMVLFLTLYGYKLCEMSLDDYDPVLNKKHLVECIKHLLVCYDAMDEAVRTPLDDRISNLKISEQCLPNTIRFNCSRHLVESLYILTNLGDLHPLRRYLNLPKQYRSELVKLSYKIAVEMMRGNFVRVCRLATQLIPITFCSFSLHLPYIQRRALHVYGHAYNSKHLTFPSAVLSSAVMFSSSDEALKVCAHYGLQCLGRDVLFNKTDFNTDAKLLQPKKMWILSEHSNGLKLFTG